MLLAATKPQPPQPHPTHTHTHTHKHTHIELIQPTPDHTSKKKKKQGLLGSVFFGCTRIVWNDAPVSVWSRGPYSPRNVSISNTAPRRDVNGDILRVQDGALTFFRDRYYLYGARYQCCPVSEQPHCYQPCGWTNATYAVRSAGATGVTGSDLAVRDGGRLKKKKGGSGPCSPLPTLNPSCFRSTQAWTS